MTVAEPATAVGLIPALRRLDALLSDAVDAATERYGPDAATDPYRGLVIGPDEVARLLDRAPGEPILSAGGAHVDRRALIAKIPHAGGWRVKHQAHALTAEAARLATHDPVPYYHGERLQGGSHGA